MTTPTPHTDAEANRRERITALLAGAIDTTADYAALRDDVADLVLIAGHRMPRTATDMTGLTVMTGDGRYLTAWRRGDGRHVLATEPDPNGRPGPREVLTWDGTAERFAALVAAVIIDAAE